MSKFIFVVLLSLPVAIYAQAPEVSAPSSTSTSSGLSTAGNPGQDATPTPQSRRFFDRDMFFGARATSVHDNPIASFNASYIYTFTDSQTGNNRSLMGWSAMPEVRLSKYIDLQADFTGLYVRSVYPGQNRLLMAAGPRYTFAQRSRFTPFVFAEGGEIRLTSQATRGSDWNPVVKGGIGLQHKLSRGIALQLIPGEYMGQLLDNHEWEHSFAARAGITFNLYH